MHPGAGAHPRGQLAQRQTQAVRLQLHGEKPARQRPGFRNRIIQHLTHFLDSGHLGPRLGGQLLFEGIVVETKADQLLAKPVMQVLADARLFAIADFQNFAFQPVPIRGVFRNPDDADDFAGAVANRKGAVPNPSPGCRRAA